jgi:hypothetical protein
MVGWKLEQEQEQEQEQALVQAQEQQWEPEKWKPEAEKWKWEPESGLSAVQGWGPEQQQVPRWLRLSQPRVWPFFEMLPSMLIFLEGDDHGVPFPYLSLLPP